MCGRSENRREVVARRVVLRQELAQRRIEPHPDIVGRRVRLVAPLARAVLVGRSGLPQHRLGTNGS